MSDMTNVTTGEVRLSYVHLFKPYAYVAGQEEKFSCTVLVPKTDTDTMGRIHAAIEAAKQKGISDMWNGSCPPIMQTPVYDGDGIRPSDGDEFGPECRGHWVFTARAKTDYPPEVVDQNLNPIINQSEMYSGVYARVNVSFFPYSFGGKKGIGCGLGAIQKLRDGEVLGGSMPSASKAFGSQPPQPAGAYGMMGQSQHGYGQPSYAQPGLGQPQGGYGQSLQPQAGYAQMQQPAASYSQPSYGPAPGQAAPAGGINPITGMPY